MSERTAFVLSGGTALGAFQAGGCRVLHDQGVRPDWIVGCSIGAVHAAIIAGNPVERRNEALRRFWSDAALPTGWIGCLAPWGPVAERWAGQIQTLLFGCPAKFAPNAPGAVMPWANRSGPPALFNLRPLRSTLEKLVDFELLNRNSVRLTVVAVDLETGDEVLFDTRRDRIGPEHILASSALLPEFEPVEIDGRLLTDGGLHANLPMDIVLREAEEPLLCFAIDLFSPEGKRFTTLGEAIGRRQELLFASQSRLLLETYHREDRLRRMLRAVVDLLPGEVLDRPDVKAALAEAHRPGMTLIRMVCRSGDEIGLRPFDYSEGAIRTRWNAGERAAAEALRALEHSS